MTVFPKRDVTLPSNSLYDIYFMKVKQLLPCFLLTATLFSCIQDEALNMEAAIDAVSGNDVHLANINVNSKQINIYVQRGADQGYIKHTDDFYNPLKHLKLCSTHSETFCA